VATRWRAIGEEGMCIVERYDRVVVGGELRRVHQEDFCQAMGVSVHAKYEEEGGPSIASCIELMREHSAVPLTDVDALLRWVAFNAIVGNADGHGKNLSLVIRDGLRLAPFYDLVCTRAYDGLDRRLAMTIGGERDPDRLRPSHLDECATSLDVKASLLRAMFERTAASILEALDVAVTAAAVGDSPAAHRTVPLVRKQARRWLRELQG
jgi:serine/threonine-protein kinase HipA